jgi:hypothetical protein
MIPSVSYDVQLVAEPDTALVLSGGTTNVPTEVSTLEQSAKS